MLEISRIREQKDQIVEALKVRKLDVSEQIKSVLSLDEEWREAKTELEQIAAESNKISKELGNFSLRGNRMKPMRLKKKRKNSRKKKKPSKKE